ncbi:Uncharacterized protein FWK35_00026444 [Aphis craccivora]|uniref:Pre-C2HC domain-containing protein n=1 Tax=Aphis craccivora TaxID=307492 RepID=A0A6G0Y0T6_APHCR|nr:Uncharacterized protein FWK35_00026444 [Aphis craccivora]
MASKSSNNHRSTITNSTSSKWTLSSSSLSPKPVDKKSKTFITPNRYSILTTLNDSNDNTQPNMTQTHSQNVTPKPPVIYIKGVSNFSSFTSNLKSIINSTEFICKTTPSYLIVHTHFHEYYRLIKFLVENSFSFHSYQQYDKRLLRVVIRNLHPSTSSEDIIGSLSELEHQAIHVHNIKRTSDKSPLPLFFVDLKKATNNMDLYKIEYLLHTKIVVEKPFPRKGPPQCHRCMSYGHTQGYCNHVPRCIRCGEEHSSNECTMSPESPAKCALCQGSHPANYKGCPAYKKLNNRPFRREPFISTLPNLIQTFLNSR